MSPTQIWCATDPRDCDEKRSEKEDEHDASGPVHLAKTSLGALHGHLASRETEENGQQADSADGQVHPEDPAPCRLFRKHSAEDRTAAGAHGPDQTQETHPLASLLDRGEISHQDVGQGEESAAADPLDAAANKHGFDGVAPAADTCASSEEE